MRKADLRKLCEDNGIAYSEKDTVPALKTLLVSAGISWQNSNATSVLSSAKHNEPQASQAATSPTLAAPLNPANANAFMGCLLSAMQTAGMLQTPQAPQASPRQQIDTFNTHSSAVDVTNTSSEFSATSAHPPPTKKRHNEVASAPSPQPVVQMTASSSGVPGPSASLSGKIPISLRYPVPEVVRKRVLDGQYVPVYKLLAGYDITTGGQMLSAAEDGSLRISLCDTASDKKMAKNPLDISMLILGLLKYKNIVAVYDPDRGLDIDSYIANLLSIYVKFPGLCYWLYHTYFWNRAFIGGSGYGGAPVDWSILDTEALHLATAAYGPALHCDHCQEYAHATARCPFQSADAKYSVTSRAVPPVNSTTGKTGLVPVFHKGKEMCPDFNSPRGCQVKSCSKLHCCFFCNQFSHGVIECKDAPRKFRIRHDEY